MDSNWFTIVFAVCAAILIVGWLTSRRLPKPEKARLYRKFHAVAVVIFLIYFVLANPFISSGSFLSGEKYEYPRNLETTEAIAKQTQEQHHRLESLEIEVKKLREEIYAAHRHYGFLLIMLLSGISGFIINSAFFNKKDNSLNNDE
jgi:hypothetical protein